MRVCDAWIRSQQDPRTGTAALSLLCATTALAAQNFKSATTAHSLFKIPADNIDDDQNDDTILRSLLRAFPGQEQLLEAARFIGWDEFPSAHSRVIEACFDCTHQFAGKILLCTGDLRQLTPVVTSRSIQDQLRASVVFSSIWNDFTVCRLHMNFRQMADPQYAAFAERIGEGILPEGGSYTAVNNFSCKIDLSTMVQTRFNPTTLNDALRWIYPDLSDHQLPPIVRATRMAARAIVANTNERVAAWNTEVQKRLPHTLRRTYFSEDQLCAVHNNDHIHEILTPETLHFCDASDVPLHELTLKVGDLCILLHNIDKSQGLTNNQRVIIRELNERSVVISIANDPRAQVHYIARLNFRLTIPGTCFEMTRKQYPMKLAYAFTVHKAQGQEMQAVLLDTLAPTFSHGQLYVALSRTRSRHGIAIFQSNEAALQDTISADNVVFPELIAQL